ncbi:MAG: hypothetical protein ACOC1K_00085 [Nanoarchaeota archaeon]
MGNFLGINKNFWGFLGEAGKSFLPNTISSMVDIFDKKGDKETAEKIKNVFSDDETRIELEKLALEKSKTDKNFQLKLKELELNEKESNLKDRENARSLAKDDNMKGHWVSKIVRPSILIVLTSAYLLLIFAMFSVQVYAMFKNFEQATNLNELFKMLLNYIQTPLSTAYMFYFGSRGAEKIYNIHKK